MRLPRTALLIGNHGPRQTKSLRRVANVAHLKPNIEFPVVHPNHIEPVLVIFAIPSLDHSKIADAVDARVLPEINEHHMSAITGNVVRYRRTLIQPHRARTKIWRGMHLLIYLPESRRHQTQG